MEFLQQSDFLPVCDNATLAVIDQSNTDTLNRAEAYAIEEVSSYCRSRYNIAAEYAKTIAPSADAEQPTDIRNPLLVMRTVDIALYHLVSWLPKRIGFEIRELRYNAAIEWLRQVQKGEVVPNFETLADTDNGGINTPFMAAGQPLSKYDY